MWTFFSVLHYLRKIFTSVQRISLDTSEIRSKNNHWGFQTSLVGFEVMTHTSRSYDEKTNTFGLNENKFDRKKDMTAFGISFNNISFKVIYYL